MSWICQSGGRYIRGPCDSWPLKGLSFELGNDRLIIIMSDRVEIQPRVCGGKPIIKGTRIPVSIILEQLAEGEAWASILAAYPELVQEDIQAALRYAKDSILHTEITPLLAS